MQDHRLPCELKSQKQAWLCRKACCRQEMNERFPWTQCHTVNGKTHQPECWQTCHQDTTPRRISSPHTQQWPRPGSCHHSSGCPRSLARTCLWKCYYEMKMDTRRIGIGITPWMAKRNYEESDFPAANGPPAIKTLPNFFASRLSSGLGNEKKPLQSNRRLGVVLSKSLRLGHNSPFSMTASYTARRRNTTSDLKGTSLTIFFYIITKFNTRLYSKYLYFVFS